MTDRAVQMYRIAGATGASLRSFSAGQWDVLLELAGLCERPAGPAGERRVSLLLAASESLGIRAEAQAVRDNLPSGAPARAVAG